KTIPREGSAGFESITGDMRGRYLLSLNNIGGSFTSTAPVQRWNVLGQKTRDQTRLESTILKLNFGLTLKSCSMSHVVYESDFAGMSSLMFLLDLKDYAYRDSLLQLVKLFGVQQSAIGYWVLMDWIWLGDGIWLHFELILHMIAIFIKEEAIPICEPILFLDGQLTNYHHLEIVMPTRDVLLRESSLSPRDQNMEKGIMNRVGSIEPFENPSDTRKLESSSYHALGACLRPYNAFLRRRFSMLVLMDDLLSNVVRRMVLIESAVTVGTTSDVHISDGNYMQVHRSFVTIAIFSLYCKRTLHLKTSNKVRDVVVPRQRLPETFTSNRRGKAKTAQLWTTTEEITLCTACIQRMDESGSSNLALFKKALAKFETQYRPPFTMEACWRILKNHPAWTEIKMPSFNQRHNNEV
ncbi:hypothetical protein Tco_0852564, partial [Tanacetum coccineum]